MPIAAARATLLLFVFAFTGGILARAEDRPPNFVVIFTDDQGYQDIGCFGSPDISTPHLDRMAEEGMRFTDFYVGAPVCSASRAALLTGCYCARTGVTGVFFPNRGNKGLNPDEITIAEVLKQKNYATACIGKWHLGDDAPFLPTEQGFDTYLGVPYSNDMSVNPQMKVAKDVVWREEMTLERMRTEAPKKNRVPLLRDDEVIEYPVDQSTLTQRYTERAIEFIRDNQDRPFFVYLPHTMPHVPLFASENFRGKSKRGLYGDVIEEIDGSVGQILQTLSDLKLDQHTLVVFTSDNGPWLSKGKDGGSALPLRDGKFTTFEGGMREPTIMWWPGHVPSGTTCGEIASTIDLLPTFAALSGTKTPQDRKIDGFDLTELITTEGAKSPRESFVYRGQAIRVGKWKLSTANRGLKKGEQTPLLFDLEADISESTNVAADHPEVVERLREMLAAHNAEIKANSRPVGVYKPEQPEQN